MPRGSNADFVLKTCWSAAEAFPSKWLTCPAGFYRSAGCFFTFYLVCVGSMLQMSAIYRLMAAASPNMDIASAAGEAQLTHNSKEYFHQALFAACCQARVLVHSLCANGGMGGLASSYSLRLSCAA